MGTVALGLVLQPSMNVTLEVPPEHVPSFTGLIISEAGEPWRPYVAIRDTEPTAKPNPYYLWVQDAQLYLSVVDQRGAGSGEGIMTVLRLSKAGVWERAGCYYFGAAYGDPQRDGDYFAFSQYLERQRPEPPERCQTGTVVLVP